MADPYAAFADPSDPYAAFSDRASSASPKPKRTLGQDVRGFMSTVNENVPGFDELSAAADVPRVMMQARVGPKAAWDAVRAQQVKDQSAYRDAHPIGADLARGTGWAAQAVPALATAGASAAPQVGGAATRGIVPMLAKGGAAVGRNAAIGGSYAAVNGLAGRGSVQERLDAGGQAIIPGAALGVALPPLVGAIGKVAGEVGPAAGRATIRAANKASGGQLLNPEQEALRRLGEAFRKDKLTPDQVTQAMNEWGRVGGPSPSFLDLVGENTKALVRGAAMKGEGRAAAVDYGNRISADAQDTAMARTRQLTPEQAPATAVAGDLETAQRNLAGEQYAEPYAQPVTMTPEALQALRGPDGHSAISRAMKGAQANQDYAQMAELQTLLTADLDNPPVVSAGALDRVKIAMGERGGQMRDAGSRDIGRGLFGRAQGIDTALEATPGLGPARATYRNLQGQRDALDLGQVARGMDPADYAAQLDALDTNSPAGATLPSGGLLGVNGARNAAGIGMRSDMVRAIGEPASNATGLLNRLGSSPNMGQRLSTTFGDQPAADYQQSLRNVVSQVNNARFINPNTGSQAAGRLTDESLVDIPTSKAGAIKFLLEKLKAGITMTDEERAAIVDYATRSPNNVPMPELMRVLRSAPRRGPPSLAITSGIVSGDRN